MYATHSELQNHLQAYCDYPVELKLNDNRSTLLSIKWEACSIKVSLHRTFLSAPREVLQALAGALAKRQRTLPMPIKTYIQDQIQKLDYSSRIRRCEHQGNVYNLKDMLEELNSHYFSGELNLNITWFESQQSPNQQQINLGLYHDSLRLIKINRLMDSLDFPDYVVKFVIYHEMLHHVCPAYVNKKGIQSIHNPAFKQREKQFKDYLQAKHWIYQHRAALFTSPEEIHKNCPDLELTQAG